MAHCLCSLLRVWLWSPFHSPKILSPIKTLKQVLIELNGLLASVRWLYTGSEVWGEGLRVNSVKLFSCSITWAEMKLLDGRWGWLWGACRKAGRCHQPQRTWELQVKEKPSSPSLSPTSGTYYSLPSTETACLRAVSTRLCLHYGLHSSCLPSYRIKPCL